VGREPHATDLCIIEPEVTRWVIGSNVLSIEMQPSRRRRNWGLSFGNRLVCNCSRTELMTAETGAKWLLRVLAITTAPAFLVAVMPQTWFIQMLHWMEPDCEAGMLLTYTMRCLMALYVILGVQFVIWSNNVPRYRPTIMSVCICCILFAIVGLTVLITTVPPDQRTRMYWIAFFDMAEGIVPVLLLTVLLLRVPVNQHQC
jgi:hypothetical protein